MERKKENPGVAGQGFKGGVMLGHKKICAKIALKVKGFMARWNWIFWGLA